MLSSVQLVTITYAGDPLQKTDEAFDAWIVGSDWFAAFGKDYGVGPGTALPPVEIATQAPPVLNDVQIDGLLTGWIHTGVLPAPTPQTLYLLYLPATTTVTDITNNDAISCTVAAGYHSQDMTSDPPFAYAVVPTCASGSPDELAVEVQGAASHEIAEATTDPLPETEPAYLLPVDSPWTLALGGGEIGDLCFPQTEAESAYTLSRIWSNTAGADGGDPCVPAPAQPYFAVDAEPTTIVLPQDGRPESVDVIGWSTGPVEPWAIAADVSQFVASNETFTPQVQLSAQTIGSSGFVQMTITAPAQLPAGSRATVVLYSAPAGTTPGVLNHTSYWPITVEVP